MKCGAVLLAIALCCVGASADTVWLKNGVSIKANKATVKGDNVVYIVGTTTYTIPLLQVDHIEKTESFGIAVSTVGPNTSIPSPSYDSPTITTRSPNQIRKAPGRTTSVTVAGGDDLLKKILVYDHISQMALNDIESQGNPQISAAAYATAANYEYSKNQNVDQARRYVQRALEYMPDNVNLLSWYSSLLLEQGETSDAIARAERAVKLQPDSADALYAAGSAYYTANRLSEAVAAWKKCIEIRPSASLQQYVAKVERELAVEGNFHERDSSHFTIRFQGQRTGFTLAAEILQTLEQQYGELSRDLGFSPQSTITVVLYTENEFFDVTQSPSWAGAINDGKLRIPVKNLPAITSAFARVLKHELTHSFIHMMARGQCPGWLNEGIAQMMEPRDPSAYAPFVARLFKEGKQIHLQSLEGSFTGFNRTQASNAYAESLVTVEYIRSVYGWMSVRRMLEALASGSSSEDALHEAISSGYDQLENNLAATLKSQYGS